jgi:hypothetical protein
MLIEIAHDVVRSVGSLAALMIYEEGDLVLATDRLEFLAGPVVQPVALGGPGTVDRVGESEFTRLFAGGLAVRAA